LAFFYDPQKERNVLWVIDKILNKSYNNMMWLRKSAPHPSRPTSSSLIPLILSGMAKAKKHTPMTKEERMKHYIALVLVFIFGLLAGFQAGNSDEFSGWVKNFFGGGKDIETTQVIGPDTGNVIGPDTGNITEETTVDVIGPDTGN
jgi:hypothetical protein